MLLKTRVITDTIGNIKFKNKKNTHNLTLKKKKDKKIYDFRIRRKFNSKCFMDTAPEFSNVCGVYCVHIDNQEVCCQIYDFRFLKPFSYRVECHINFLSQVVLKITLETSSPWQTPVTENRQCQLYLTTEGALAVCDISKKTWPFIPIESIPFEDSVLMKR